MSSPSRRAHPTPVLEVAFSLHYNTSDVHRGGTAFINGQLMAGDLAFRVYAQEVFTPPEAWNDFVSSVSGDVPSFAFYTLPLAAVGATPAAAARRTTSHRTCDV